MTESKTDASTLLLLKEKRKQHFNWYSNVLRFNAYDLMFKVTNKSATFGTLDDLILRRF